MGDWIEVNLVAPAAMQPTQVLLRIVDPLVHEQLADRIDMWFYFWEPELRLRIRWRDPRSVDANRRELTDFLDNACRAGTLKEWFEGSHGRRGGTYRGESGFYGAEVWELVARDWTNASELALALARIESEGRLTRPRSFHWSRRVHLFSNQLLVDEIALCLAQARSYLRSAGVQSSLDRAVVDAIENYLDRS
jgi:hypothetical protein